jgi:hypothetical protein
MPDAQWATLYMLLMRWPAYLQQLLLEQNLHELLQYRQQTRMMHTNALWAYQHETSDMP